MLIEEAAKKAAIAWLSGTGAGAYPVWCLWLDGALYVVSGPGEQPAPGLSGAATAQVSLRGDHGGRIVTWPAAVERITPEHPDWTTVAPQVAAKRLNAPGTTEETVARWAAGDGLYRLTPAGEPLDRPDDSEAAPPVPTPATNRTAKPFKLHRVRGEKR